MIRRCLTLACACAALAIARPAVAQRTDFAGSLGLGGELGANPMAIAFPAAVRLELVPTVPFVLQGSYIHEVYTWAAYPGQHSPDRFTEFGGGYKLSDELGVEGHYIATAGWEHGDTTYTRYQEMAASARHYRVVRFGYFNYQYNTAGPTGALVNTVGHVNSTGFYVGYSVNTLLSASGGLAGLKTVNTLLVDLLFGSVPAYAGGQNKIGIRGAWTTDFGNIFSMRFEGGWRPASGYYGFGTIDLFIIKTAKLF
jgi:hypothetical protein